MRLGVLEFASAAWAAVSVVDPLRARDVDVVSGDSVVFSLEESLREAGRAARADCDGVLLAVGEGSPLEAVAAAAVVLAGVPLLLAGEQNNRTFFDAVGTLESIGARFDRISFVPGELDPAAYLETWLKENSKNVRQKGLEAARKLYGQRLYIPAEKGVLPDAALWMHQFGVIPTSEAEGADFVAEEGDACGALTSHLLSLVSAEPTGTTISIVAPRGADSRSGDSPVTLARITRNRGRFRCLLLRGALAESDGSSARFDCSDTRLFAVASSPFLHAVPGDHMGTMHAACDALDIDTVVLR